MRVSAKQYERPRRRLSANPDDKREDDEDEDTKESQVSFGASIRCYEQGQDEVTHTQTNPYDEDPVERRPMRRGYEGKGC